VMRLADEEQRGLLRGLVEGTVEPDPVDARAALADVLLTLLPADHPLVAVLRTGTMFGTGHGRETAAEVALYLQRLRSLVLPPEAGTEPPGPPASGSDLFGATGSAGWDDYHREVQARLLELPALSPDEVRDRGVDPDDSWLIRLTGPDLEVHLPAFQFAGPGAPWPVVLEVNRLLDAAADPWGVTCWWVDPHARLDAVPAGLLGRGQDRLLVRAAAAVREA
jgi:hypothetical protein